MIHVLLIDILVQAVFIYKYLLLELNDEAELETNIH